MDIKSVKSILANNDSNIAFLIGNGINLHYKNDTISWSKLLLSLWQRYAKNPQTTIPTGISFTEFYDALEIQNAHKKNFSSNLQKEVKNTMLKWTVDYNQNLILDKIKELDAPILTTNFDRLMPNSMNLKFQKLRIGSFTDYYPWSCYYSDCELKIPSSGFGIWYPNGMLKYHRSIKLGLTQYMGNVERARQLINYSPANNEPLHSAGQATWLDILFNKSLFIFGFGLDESEVFMRWLLIERAKYFRKHPDKEQKGWYIAKKGSISQGKKFFLNSVGIDIIEMESYTEIYENIWK